MSTTTINGRSPCRARAVLAVLVTMTTTLAGTAWLTAARAATASSTTSAAALPDDFYVPPSPLPAGNPGDVIRSRPAGAGPPSATAIADAWQVMYLTTDALGQRTTATGTVLVPKASPAGARVVIGFGPGTHGPAFRCAPSRMISGGSFYEQPAVNDMLNDGYAVAVTDYEGYRPPATATTYVAGRAMGAALLDVVRASQRLGITGVTTASPVVLRGYSQGGGAAMWGGQLQPSYARDVRLIGVAGGGVPADPVQLALSLNGSAGFGVLAYALIGLDNAYPELDLDSYLTPAGKTAFADLEANACILELLLDYQGKRVGDYTSSSPVLQPAWTNRYAENTLGGQPINAPVYQYQVANDELVAPAQASALRTKYCNLGMAVTWTSINTGVTGMASHIHGVYWGNQDVRTFIADRVGGKPATTNC